MVITRHCFSKWCVTLVENLSSGKRIAGFLCLVCRLPLVCSYLLIMSWGSAVELRAGEPRSLMRLYGEGYGIVLAEVIQQLREKGVQPTNVSRHRVTFKVQEVVTRPLEGDAFSLKARDYCTLWLTAGPGAMLPLDEDGKQSALTKGIRYFLVLRYDKSRAVYEHAPDIGLLQPVVGENQGAIQYMRALHDLARLPVDLRIEHCKRILSNRQAGEPLRHSALDELIYLEDSSLSETLQQIWNEPDITMSDSLAIELDTQTQRLLGNAFSVSDARKEYWLRRFFQPMARGNVEEVRMRNNLLLPMVVEVGQFHSEQVGNLLLVGINDPQWSPSFRVVLLRVMMNLYRTVDTLPRDWHGSLPRAVKILRKDLGPKEQNFFTQVMNWAADPPGDREKRRYP